MSSSSGKVGADAFASIRPSTNPTFTERTSTTGADPPPPQAPSSSSPSSSGYTMRVTQQDTLTTATTTTSFAASGLSNANTISTATLPSRGRETAFDFSGKRDDAFFAPPPPSGSTASLEGIPNRFRVGDGDLRPTPQGMGGIGGVIGGGNYIGSNHPAFQPRSGGGLAHSQPTHPNGARYLPMFPGDPGVGPQPSYGSGGPGPNGVFSGEPDPDHLPPFDLSRLQQSPNQHLPRQFGGGPPNNNFYC